jgi:Terminase-like family.
MEPQKLLPPPTQYTLCCDVAKPGTHDNHVLVVYRQRSDSNEIYIEHEYREMDIKRYKQEVQRIAKHYNDIKIFES